MCTDLTEEASKWMFDQESFPAKGDIGEEDENAIAFSGRRGFAAIATTTTA